MPAYLLAMVYGHLLDVAGPVQAGLREALQLRVGEYAFPAIRSPFGAIFMLTLSLYPYVYLTAKQAFAQQNRHIFEAAWLLGLTPARWFWRIALPAARPALALGVALVMMEALADFGVVSLFGVPSFTTGIYRAWYGLGDAQQAAKLALLMLMLVGALIALERLSRGRIRAARAGHNKQPLPHLQTSCARAWYHTVACAAPVMLGFVLPAGQLFYWAGANPANLFDALHWQAAGHALLVAASAATGALLVALLFSYRFRARPPRWQAALLSLPRSAMLSPAQ
jgi:ABC-type Fe3+ transport system, permease component